MLNNMSKTSYDQILREIAIWGETFTDRNFVGSVLTLSTTAAFPSTSLESLVLDWEGR